MYWVAKYKYGLWSKYNYILAAAFDAGFNVNMLVVFFGVWGGEGC